MKQKTKTYEHLLPWVIPVLVVVLWYYYTTTERSGINLFPAPVQICRALVRLVQDGSLWNNIVISSKRAAGGFLVGGVIGFVLGLLTGMFPVAEKVLNTPIQMIRNVPFLAMMPLILIWFGIGELAKIVLISLGTFFPVYLNTFHGIRYVDRQLVEMGTTYGLSGFGLFREIILPGSMPSVMIGIKQSLGRMWMTLIVAETVAAKSGIGYMATNAREFMLMDVILLSLILYALLGVASDFAATLLERRILRWHANYRKQ